jgi:hypothetical protein
MLVGKALIAARKASMTVVLRRIVLTLRLFRK